MTTYTLMTISSAVREARLDVTMYEVSPIAGGHRGYVVATYDHAYRANVESQPTWHARALQLRRAAIVRRACDLLQVSSLGYDADPLAYAGQPVLSVVRHLAGRGK